VIRHDTAHVLAEAVQELFPGTQVNHRARTSRTASSTISPANEPFALEDLGKIEARMREIVDRDEAITREVVDRNAAIADFEAMGEIYKADIIRDIPVGEAVTVYHQGGWKDLCRGPHLPSTRHVGKAFKTDQNWPAPTGAATRPTPNSSASMAPPGPRRRTSDAYLKRVDEAERRDHRKLGRAMDLFHLQEEGRGMVFWHPKAGTLYRTLEAYMRRRLEADGYQEVKTPQVLDRNLWERSGHWEKFHDNSSSARRTRARPWPSSR